MVGGQSPYIKKQGGTMEMTFAKKLNRLERLKKVHRHLDKEIQKDYNRLQDVSAQKIEKLKLKDQIVQLEKEVERDGSYYNYMLNESRKANMKTILKSKTQMRNVGFGLRFRKKVFTSIQRHWKIQHLQQVMNMMLVF